MGSEDLLGKAICDSVCVCVTRYNPQALDDACSTQQPWVMYVQDDHEFMSMILRYSVSGTASLLKIVSFLIVPVKEMASLVLLSLKKQLRNDFKGGQGGFGQRREGQGEGWQPGPGVARVGR